MAIRSPEMARHLGFKARGVPNSPPPILYYLVLGRNKCPEVALHTLDSLIMLAVVVQVLPISRIS